jgi:tetratricopeptide (TPR) repeat protein
VDPTYSNEIDRILSIHHQASAGKIIFVDRFKPPPCVEANIRVVEVSEDPTERPPQLSSLTKKDLDLIGELKFLRFGETPRAIAMLTGRAGGRMALERLSASGYLKSQGNRYRLRDELLDELTSRGNAERFLQQKLAKRFEGLSKYALRGHDLNWDHFLLEAEFHYFAAAMPYRAAKVLSQMMGQLTGLAGTDSASWVAGTLRPFFVIEASGKRVLSKLPATTRLSFLRAFETAIDTCHVELDEAAQKGLDVVIEHLEEPLRLVYAGEGLSDREEYLEAIQHFNQAVKLLSRRKTSRLLGVAQQQIGASYYALAFKYGLPHHLDNGKTWAAAAQRTYHKLGEKLDEATALDNLGLYYIQRSQNHRRALSFVQRALKILRRKPGFSKDKGVVYGNAASVYLKAGNIDLAEGYFLESALHYMSVGDFEGIGKLYVSLFKYLSQRAPKAPLTMRRLYEVAFYVWGYPSQPSDLLRPNIVVVNELYFAYTLQERDASGAARAIDDRGYITIGEPPEWRVAFTKDRIKRYCDVIGKKAFATVLLPRLRQSAWWRETEKSDFLAYPG